MLAKLCPLETLGEDMLSGSCKLEAESNVLQVKDRSVFSLSAEGRTYVSETSLWNLHMALISRSQQLYVYLIPSLWHPLLPHSLVPSLRNFSIYKAHMIQLDLLG